MMDEFEAVGVRIVVVSSNDRETAERTVEEWHLDRLPVGYGLPAADARGWGLYFSAAMKETEPERFTEPGLFLVRRDGTLYFSVVQTMPFGRPPAAQLLSTISWIAENDYPARGELAVDA